MRYTRRDGCRAWLTYAQMQPDKLRKILFDLGDADSIYDDFTSHGPSILKGYATPEQIEILKQRAEPEAMHEMMTVMQKYEMGVVSIDDFRYPNSLRNIDMPPALLFYRGDLDCTLNRCITIVGSRKPSKLAEQATLRISYDLARHKVHIVSGLAQGVDTLTHRGCMQGGCRTIGVAACGLDVNYPAGTKRFKADIVNGGGLLLSEYPPGTPALSWHFPVRNRILAGLSDAVIFVEAKLRSGSMITVQHALNQGKSVFAFPGAINTPFAEGSHQLLREGAIYFTDANDVLEDMGWQDEYLLSEGETVPEEQRNLPPMTNEQRTVFLQIAQGDKSFDQLCQETKLDSPALFSTLTILQLMGLVKPLPGKIYTKA